MKKLYLLVVLILIVVIFSSCMEKPVNSFPDETNTRVMLFQLV